jgi:hypothetical protein
LNWPAAQGAQLGEPPSDENPVPQGWQAIDPAMGAEVPGGQALQVGWFARS